MPTAKLCSIAVIAGALVFAAAPASGDDDSWKVKGKLLGKPSTSEDVSGIACAPPDDFPRSCLVIDDNLQAAQFVTLEDGKLRTGAPIKLIEDKFEGMPLELDGEGVAFSNGIYYVIGSHGHPRDKDKELDPVKDRDLIKARIAASSQIVRFRAKDGFDAKVERTSNLKKIIEKEELFKGFADERLEKNGVTIEGIAIKDDGTLFAGFRGPVLDDDSKALVLSAPVDALFGNGVVQHKLVRLPLGKGRGVRDLASFEGRIFILAGPWRDESGVYAIYAWDGKGGDVTLLSELTQFKPKRKPEGLLPLDRKGKQVRMLILFDSDEEGTPTPVTVTMD